MTVIKVIIPAFNEQESVVRVVQDIPADKVDEIVVVNNNSTDMTARVAQQAGVTVVDEPRRGYGYACLAGMDYIAGQELLPDIIVFMDADYSDHPEELPKVVAPISNEGMDLVIGTRKKDLRERGSMTFPQVFGNWLATRLMRLIYGSRFTDLGPFRAIRYDRLMELNMQDKTFGWTVEMQIKVLKRKLNYTEVPVHYRNRIGVSKISGTIKGTLLAGYKILGLIFKYSLR
ncbi:MAG TPA: UDP-glucose--dolichyl-phosphate glucosyltransferase [Cryomorphaceae bacterium]|nr:UDP-glucose--dolichyl-phosphate glucosyltransferase [Owenweeksia sp.]MBG00136.1 UDP-glucose--dolichyl-phosphate glucosyltransferase [Owenweeksia sp.]HAD96150.1 UDP-glucose--dolichyl-phosphate glucosyltransferase [Cryomorphaceae bacterium]HBF20308.1 UDP-glucose--dolichyl-phosphate glucosyltransferase [Cryomorphaceae bacterium]|tara:strand:- start:31973 stop:32665 length:693 start_codon:yes stop_codon:yes gene_type:complete